MKKLSILFIILIFLLNSQFVSAMDLSAKSAVLLEADTGRVIYSKNSREKMGMASTTKIMTALVALDNYNPSDVVTASYKAATTEGSSIYLKPGEKMSLEHIIYGLLLASGNDAAVAIAEHIGKNQYDFVDLMNKKVVNLGLNDTHFSNPNGLSDKNHFTTAYDLAMITREALKNEVFCEIVATKNKVLKSLSGENDRYIKNHNKLLWQYDGCTGVKTGFTKKDGRCLVSAATKNNVKLIAVTLNATDDWNDHRKMFDFGFGCMNRVKIINQGAFAGNVSVENGMENTVKCIYKDNFLISMKDDDKVLIKKNFISNMNAPVKKGDIAGYVEVYINNIKFSQIDIIAEENIDLTNKNKFIRQFTSMLISLI